VYISKIYADKQAKKMLLKMSDYYHLDGGSFRWRRPCVSAMTEALKNGEFEFIRMADGKRFAPKGCDALKAASRFYKLGGEHPHQHRPSAIAILRAVADGDIDIADSEGKRFWQ
jgi:hypothetical protein